MALDREKAAGKWSAQGRFQWTDSLADAGGLGDVSGLRLVLVGWGC